MDKIEETLDIAFTYSQIDGSHHKTWVIDQMVRKLLGTEEAYNKWIKNYCKEGDDPEAYEWDTGIAP